MRAGQEACLRAAASAFRQYPWTCARVCMRVWICVCGGICFSHNTSTGKQRSEYLWPGKARCPPCEVLVFVCCILHALGGVKYLDLHRRQFLAP
jgi:hypothetical protein